MTENHKADLAIIGGGAAGLTAAAAAAEKGVKDIIVLESRKGVGGNANFVFGMFAAESHIQKFYGIECRRDMVFKEMMHYNHWKNNPRLLRALVDKTADTMQWLEDKGVKWGGILSHFPGQTPRAHHYAVGANTTGAAIVNSLLKTCDESGVQIFKQTRARKLLKDGEGNISGVVAETKDKEITINARSVILATGGLYGNEELIRKTIQYPLTYEEKEFIPWGLPHPGDGLQMAVDIGAARDGRILYEMHAPIFFGELKLTAYIVPISHKTVWVNKNGERFADETISDLFAESANAVVRQPGKVMYCLFDDSIKKKILKQGFSEFELAVGVMLPGGVPKNKDNPELLEKDFDKDLVTNFP